MVVVAVPPDGGVTVDGVKLHAALAGWPEHEKLTGLLKPLRECTVHLTALLKVELAFTFDGLHVRLKSPEPPTAVTCTLMAAVLVDPPLVPVRLNP